MLEYLSSLYESMIDLSPDEVIGALVIGLALAMACAGLCLLAQKKAANPYSLLCGLIFAISAASLAIGVGHARNKYIGGQKLGGGFTFLSARKPGGVPGPDGHPRARRPGRNWLQEADADRNGQLTPDEAARFVREADTTGKGWIDVPDFDRLRRGRGGPPSVTENLPSSGTPAPDRGGE